MRDDLKGRPTADVIVIYLTLVVSSILVATTAVGLFLKLTSGQNTTSDLFAFEGEVIKGFTAIIIGYIAGRGVTNGKEK